MLLDLLVSNFTGPTAHATVAFTFKQLQLQACESISSTSVDETLGFVTPPPSFTRRYRTTDCLPLMTCTCHC